MKLRLLFLAFLSSCNVAVIAAPLGTAFNYQGRLMENGQPATGSYDIRFGIYDVAAGGASDVATTNVNVTVANGLFTTVVDFGSRPNSWTAQWLELGVRTNGSASAFNLLTPRQPVLAAPFAFYAAEAEAAATVTGPVNASQIANLSYTNITSGTVPDQRLSTNVPLLGSSPVFSGSVTATGDLAGRRLRVGTGHVLLAPWATIAGGVSNTVSSEQSGIGAGALNVVEAGQSASIAGGERNRIRSAYTHIAGGTNNFIDHNSERSTIGGGSDNRIGVAGVSVIAGGHGNMVSDGFAAIGGGGVNTNRAYASVIGGGTYNLIAQPAQHGLIAGGSFNDIYAFASTIAGGIGNSIGTNANYAFLGAGRENAIQNAADYAVLSGGRSNVVPARGFVSFTGGGHGNTNQSPWGVLSGGYGNVAGEGAVATVAGGETNRSLGWRSAVGGGFLNTSSSYAGTVAGGEQNTSSGSFAAIPGGLLNEARGLYSFAAGRRAKALHDGSFVWGDDTDANFSSTGTDQFLVRARGGVGLGTANPQGTLHVYATNNPTVVRIQSTGTPGLGRVEFVSNPQGDGNEWRPAYIQSLDAGSFTGGLGIYVNGTGTANKFGVIETMRVVNGRVGIRNQNPASPLDVSGTVTATAFNPTSDRNMKENFTPVKPREVLAKVAALPLSQWNFKTEPEVRHTGPMAQDFHAAFGLGTDDRHISTVDADGVALAAIQGLNDVVKEKDAQIQNLQRDVAELKRLVNELMKDRIYARGDSGSAEQ